jgi:hypothetical protein
MKAMVIETIPTASKVSGILEAVKVTYAERPMFVHGYIEEMLNKMKTAHSCLGNN